MRRAGVARRALLRSPGIHSRARVRLLPAPTPGRDAGRFKSMWRVGRPFT